MNLCLKIILSNFSVKNVSASIIGPVKTNAKLSAKLNSKNIALGAKSTQFIKS